MPPDHDHRSPERTRAPATAASAANAAATPDSRVRVIRHETVGGRTRLMLAAGSARGIEVGMAVHTRCAGELVIEEVTANASYAFADGQLDQVDALVVIDRSRTTSRKRTVARRGVANAAQPLPHLGAISASFGHHDLSAVRAQIGGAAAEAGAELGARAYAFGDQVAFATAPDLHTAAHEAAHVVQQRAGLQPGASDAHEETADLIADAVVRGESAVASLDVVVRAGTAVASAEVQRKPDAAAARTSNGLARYFYVHAADLEVALAQHLVETTWPDPAPDTPFAPGGERVFRRVLVNAIATQLRNGDSLPALVHPGDLAGRFRELVPNLAEANWVPEVGRSFAQLVERAAVTSLRDRIGPRYRAALASRTEPPHADELIASHPIDPLVALALVVPRVIDTSQVAATSERGPTKLAPVEARWLGHRHPELWNFVQVAPATASIEEVAATLWGAPEKSTMAIAVRKYGDVFRVAPAHARQLIAARYRGEVIGTSDVDESNATQLLALARSSIGRHVTKQQIGRSGVAASTGQLAAIDRDIGRLIDRIRATASLAGVPAPMAEALGARAARMPELALGDARKRAEWLPVLQFQHAQLLAIAEAIRPIVERLAPYKGRLSGTLDKSERRQRDKLRATLVMYVQAASVSHLRDESTAILRDISKREHAEQLDALDNAQLDLDGGTRDALGSKLGPIRGTNGAAESIAHARQIAIAGRGGSSYDQQKAATLAGEVALQGRMRATEQALVELQNAADEVFADPEAMQRMYPGIRPIRTVIADVRAHLADVERAWRDAERTGTPTVVEDTKAPADWAEWTGRAAGLTAARTAFAKIAGDESVRTFVQRVQKQMRHERIVQAAIRIGATLLIVVASSVASAALGNLIVEALVAESATFATRAIAFGIDIGINASINTVVQLAVSDGQGSFGWLMLENVLVEVLTRGIMNRVRAVEQSALAEGRRLAQLPHLDEATRAAVMRVDFAGTQAMAELVGGMATQWAAHRVVQLFHHDKREVSEQLAYTVLQQGAAVGLGKYFHGRIEAWRAHRKLLEQTRAGRLPEMRALFEDRERFFLRAAELEHGLSPDPAAGERLTNEHTNLIRRERLVLEHVPELSDVTPSAHVDSVAKTHVRDVGAYEVTSEAVPGSQYKGKAEHEAEPTVLLAHAHDALRSVAASRKDVRQLERAHVDGTASEVLRAIATNTYVVHLPDGKAITIRVSVAPLEAQTVARSVMNPSKHGVTSVERSGSADLHVQFVEGRYVIQVSNKMDVANVRRAIAHEVAEILARRELHLANRLPGTNVLANGGDPAAELSPHDRGRIAELVEVVRDLETGDATTKHAAEHELTALIEDMGLREGVDGADKRFERIREHLSPEANERIAKARAHESKLSTEDAHKLQRLRDEATKDLAERAAYQAARKPLHEMPTTGKRGKVSPAERKRLAEDARVSRAQASTATLRKIRAQNANGEYPTLKLQIGGNASLAARDPKALLVDANERWAVDRSEHLAQTAQQMEPIKAAGIGDPYEFADAGERVPLEAILFWQDKIAAQGPVIDGRAELGVKDGRLVATIHPNDRSPPVIVAVDGVPVVATGFTHEYAPGTRGMSPRQAIMTVDTAVRDLTKDPHVGALATKARDELASIQGIGDGDAGKTLAQLPPELRSKIELQKDARNALAFLETQKAFDNARANDPRHVFYGDEANQITDEQLKHMKRVVIAGTGGTGISAAEIILARNSTVRVSMVGKDSPAGLAENGQFRQVIADYGTKELAHRLHIAPGRLEGRFEIHDGYYLGAMTGKPGAYDVNAQPNADGTRPPSEATQGDTYVAAMGRFNDLPPPLAKLVNDAQREGRDVEQVAIIDEGFYLGYTLVITQADKSLLEIDVTGAASRFVDKAGMRKADRDAVEASSEHDAPPESGIFDGSYAASAQQAARYRAWRKRNRR